MSKHDGRLYNYLEQIVSALKTHRPQGEDKPKASEAKNGKSKWSIWVSLLALVVSIISVIVSNRTASVALHISNRAYLAVGDLSIYCPLCEHPDQIPPPKNPPEATAVILINTVNYGRTPASIIDMNLSGHDEIGHGLPLNFDFVEYSEADFPGSNYVAPDPSHPLQIKLPARAEDIVTARGQVLTQRTPGQSRAKYLYIYGHITYRDVFDKRHVLLVCRQYIGQTNTIPENWSRCSMHDGEDDSFVPQKKHAPPGFVLPQYNAPEPPDNVPPALRQPAPQASRP